jgi:hypothetical protein
MCVMRYWYFDSFARKYLLPTRYGTVVPLYRYMHHYAHTVAGIVLYAIFTKKCVIILFFIYNFCILYPFHITIRNVGQRREASDMMHSAYDDDT